MPAPDGLLFNPLLDSQEAACQILCTEGGGYGLYYKYRLIQMDLNSPPEEREALFAPYYDLGYYGEGICRDSFCPWRGTVVSVLLQGDLHCPEGFLIEDFKCVREGIDPHKNNDCTAENNGCPLVGDPIHLGTGQHLETETDFEGQGNLKFTRYYGSGTHWGKSPLGWNWRHTYMRSLLVYGSTGAETIIAVRPTNDWIIFLATPGGWKPESDVRERINEIKQGNARVGWELTNKDQSVEHYDLHGRLISISYIDGDELTLSYNGEQLTEIIDRAGHRIHLKYASSLLEEVVFPDGNSAAYTYTSQVLSKVIYNNANRLQIGIRQYIYDATSSRLLSGIVDEDQHRFASWIYDNSGNAVVSTHGVPDSPIDRVTVEYSTGVPVVVNSMGDSASYSYVVDRGVIRITGVSHRYRECGNRKSRSYDENGFLDVLAAYSDAVTNCDYDTRGLETQRVEAANDTTGKKRTTQTDWHATLAVPTERRTYNATGTLVAKSTWTYNGRGQPLTASMIDPATGVARTTTTTYCEQPGIDANTCPLLGLTLSVDGPRTDVNDVTAYTYYQTDDANCATAPTTCPHRKGDLWKVSNALGLVTTYLAYDGAGRLLFMQDANGVVTAMTYHPRGWLTSRTVRGINGAPDRVTTIDHWPTGLVKQVTQPDGSFTAYTYDAAHRLTDIGDNAGNTIHYTLDNAGNRIKENTRDPGGQLTRTLSRVYNQLGQLQTQADAQANPTDFTYDANGNVDTVKDALNRVTDNDYDPLNRQTRTLQDVAGIAAETQFQYDALDNLIQVIDPKNLVTTYVYNGLSDLTSLNSPDTGTSAYTYDSAGNRRTQTDARGKTATYSYDALNRLTDIAYPTSSLNVVYQYDAVNAVCGLGETYAVGRLARITDASGSTQYCYDRYGALVRKVQTTGGKGAASVAITLRYGYDNAGRLNAIVYPDSSVVDYVRDALGQVTEVGMSTPSQPRRVVVTDIGHAPFGPATGWIYGNGRMLQRPVDQDYRPRQVFDAGAGGLSLGYGYDAVGNLGQLKDGTLSQLLAQYGYDGLNRLTQAKDANQTVLQAYAYDATGNRTSFTEGPNTTPYTYAGASHRLVSVGALARSYDNAGNTVADGGASFYYNDAGRLRKVTGAGPITDYTYNGKGEQVARNWNTILGQYSVRTVYDEAGRLVGEYDAAGTPQQQVIWVDDLPVGLLTGTGATQKLHYIEPDHLGTPRVIIDGVRNVAIWRWPLTGEAFGRDAPQQDPDGDGQVLEFALRFPGQRYDAASGLNYNYFRDYDPATGRYVESDPIGLKGGLSTYGYASQKPTSLVDPKGLLAFGPTCNAQMRATIIQAVIELSNEITSKANAAAKNCEKGTTSPRFQ